MSRRNNEKGNIICDFGRIGSEELIDEEYTKLILNLMITYEYVIKKKYDHILWVEGVEIQEINKPVAKKNVKNYIEREG